MADNSTDLTDTHHDWVLDVFDVDPRSFGPFAAKTPDEAVPGAPSQADDGGPEPGLLDKARMALAITGEFTGISVAIQGAAAIAEKVEQIGSTIAHHPADAAAGLVYGAVQGLAPLGFAAPSPNPKSAAFELGRGVGMMAGGAITTATAAGEEVIGTGLDATGVGALAGVPINVIGAATAASGVTAMVGGAALTSHAMSMTGDGGGDRPRPVKSEQTLSPSESGSLKGQPKKIEPNLDNGGKLAIQRENESAKTLSEHGQAVEQLPEKGPTGQPNPDIEIDGVKGDVYSPQGSNLNTISREIVRKSSWTGPTVVVNLTDSTVTIEALVAEIKASPGNALRDLYIIKPGSDGVAIVKHLTFGE